MCSSFRRKLAGEHVLSCEWVCRLSNIGKIDVMRKCCAGIRMVMSDGMEWDGMRRDDKWQMLFLFAILQLCTHFNCPSIKQEAQDHPRPSPRAPSIERIFLLIISKFFSRAFSVVGTCKVLLWYRRRSHCERKYPTNEFQLISTHPTETEFPPNSLDWIKNLNNFDPASRCPTVSLDISVFFVGAKQWCWCFTNLFFV